MVKDERHYHDGGSAGNGDALAFHGVGLHDLTAAGTWRHVAIKLADQGSRESLMVFVVPRIEAAENQNNQSIHKIGKSDAAGDDKHIYPTIHRAEGVLDTLDDLLELIP